MIEKLLAEVLKNGCKQYPSRKAVCQKMDDMMGSVFDISIIKKGKEQILFFYLETVKHEKELLEQAFTFLQNMLLYPLQEGKGFPKKIVEIEKEILAEKIKSRQDENENVKQSNDIQKVEETLHTAQSRIVLGFDTNISPEQKEFACLLVCNELFGGSPTSLLFQNVREKEGACYDISSFLFRLYPILMVKAGIEKQYYNKAVDIIQNCLKTLQQKKVDSETLEQAKQNMIRYYISMKDSQTALMDFALNEWILKTNRTIEQFIKEIEQVTIEDVQKRAKEIHLNTIYFLQ